MFHCQSVATVGRYDPMCVYFQKMCSCFMRNDFTRGVKTRPWLKIQVRVGTFAVHNNDRIHLISDFYCSFLDVN